MKFRVCAEVIYKVYDSKVGVAVLSFFWDQIGKLLREMVNFLFYENFSSWQLLLTGSRLLNMCRYVFPLFPYSQLQVCFIQSCLFNLGVTGDTVLRVLPLKIQEEVMEN